MARPLLALFLLAAWSAADDRTDTSLQGEVEHYLAKVDSPEGDPGNFRVFWKGGLRLETGDKRFTARFNGRLHWDSHWRSSGDFAGETTADGTFFRRIELTWSGTLYRNTVYKVQFGFVSVKDVAGEDTADGSGGDTTVNSVILKDVYGGLKNVPVAGTIFLGHVKEPLGMEQGTSSNHLTLMERSAPTNAFTPDRNAGIMLRNTALADDRLAWAAGFFRTTDAFGTNTEDGGYSFTMRLSGIPFENPENGVLVHTGFALSFRDPPGETISFRARPGTGNGPRLVSTGNIPADEVLLLGFEFAMAWRAFFLQAEFFLADVTGPAGAADPGFSGWYVEASWWVTGETRPYRRSQGRFVRVAPRQDFHDDRGPGAWQVAFRYDTIDLNDGAITGGEQDTLTFGVNWHWNPHARVMWNVVLADVEGGGDLTIFQTRFQFDF